MRPRPQCCEGGLPVQLSARLTGWREASAKAAGEPSPPPGGFQVRSLPQPGGVPKTRPHSPPRWPRELAIRNPQAPGAMIGQICPQLGVLGKRPAQVGATSGGLLRTRWAALIRCRAPPGLLAPLSAAALLRWKLLGFAGDGA
ncbi:hypothetical protein VTJ04DRAFT_2346 [Mycothermus thermophilus]|uniref:uncharacterized protein n=1 Tax=Humicola insolens TaxID=85995 RepID=UPI003742E29B